MHPEALRITASLICDFPSVCTVWRILLSDSGWMNICWASNSLNPNKQSTICLVVLTLDVWWEPQARDHQESQKALDHSHWLGEEGQNIKTAFWSFPSLLNTDLQVKNKHYRCFFIYIYMVGQQANYHLGPAKGFFRSARNQLPGSKNTDTRKLDFALPQNNSNTINNVQLNKHQPSDNKKCLWCHKICFLSISLTLFLCVLFVCAFLIPVTLTIKAIAM